MSKGSPPAQKQNQVSQHATVSPGQSSGSVRHSAPPPTPRCEVHAFLFPDFTFVPGWWNLASPSHPRSRGPALTEPTLKEVWGCTSAFYSRPWEKKQIRKPFPKIGGRERELSGPLHTACWPAGDNGAGMSGLPDPGSLGSLGSPQWALHPGNGHRLARAGMALQMV